MNRTISMRSLTSLSYAIVVAEKKSISSAARVLNIQQSVVSRHIRNLEDMIGVSIFERVSSGIRLTLAGKRFLEHSEVVLAEFDRAMKVAASAAAGVEGEIHLGIEAQLSDGFLIGLLHDFIRLHKNVSINIIEGSKSEHLSRLLRKEIDFAFVHAKLLGNDHKITSLMFDTQVFWQTKLYIAVPHSHRLAEMSSIPLQELKGDHVLLGSYCCDELLKDYQLALEPGRTYDLSIDKINVGRDALMNMVGLGLGVTFTTEAWAAGQYERVTIRPLQGAISKLHFRGVWHPQNDNPAFRRFLSLARSKAILKNIA